MCRVAARAGLGYACLMAAGKKSVSRKKPKITARDVTVGNRTLEAVLIDLAERSSHADERSARADERSARADERSARAEELSSRAEYKAAIALETIAAVSRDLRTMVEEMRAANARADARLTALENRPGT
jgi:hypothetical protein